LLKDCYDLSNGARKREQKVSVGKNFRSRNNNAGKTLSKEVVMDECEEKKLMDKIVKDPNNEFAGKERVCDKDVEKVLWKLNEEPKIVDKKSNKMKLGSDEKPMKSDSAKEEILPDIGDVSAHSASL
jgi:hypothetical protein